jgi:tetratricopeptide (TPR) repeat protein
MALDLYSPCPCGSGKKFKWCCQPIHVQLDRAFQQDAAGQHDAALHTIEEVVVEHPSNPEVWGRKAELLYRNGRADDAENALQKAFEINPNYPFGLMLQGMFRQNEGELAGALLLFRKAADAYDPEARDNLAHLYGAIAENELRMNRPVATRAALRIAVHFDPNNEELRGVMDGYFGDKSNLPLAARKDYTFLPAAATLSPERRVLWDEALARAATGKLSDAARAFDQVTGADPENAAAWHNLGLARAWLGDNNAALTALDRYVALEPDEARAADAWALGEVLRLGHGMEEQADLVETSVMFQIRDAKPVSACLQAWQEEGRLLVMQAREDQPVFSALVLERITSLTGDRSSAPPPHLDAYLMIVNDRVRVWNTNRAGLDRVRDELRQKVGPALVEGRTEQVPASFNDALAEALVFPVNVPDKDIAEQRVRQQMERFFEEVWIHRPLKALGGVPPSGAAGSGSLRKKLLGVVQFLGDIITRSGQPYDLEGLRRKLGLLGPAPAAAASASTGPDIGSLGAAELSALQPETLADEQLAQAFKTALQLDARELAGRFAKTIVARPAASGQGDRYGYYNHLVLLAQAEGNSDAALDYVNQGEKADLDHNEGLRQNDYELRRAQIHAKRGEADAAQGVFDRLIERVPGELRYRASAAEAMLSARQGPRALRFAEGGLAKAREQNNRDSEQHFQELAAAARKMG